MEKMGAAPAVEELQIATNHGTKSILDSAISLEEEVNKSSEKRAFVTEVEPVASTGRETDDEEFTQKGRKR